MRQKEYPLMPTFITFDQRMYSDPDTLIFGVWNYDDIPSIYVKGSKNGIITIEAIEGTNIKSFINLVVGIFLPESNFISTVCHWLGVSVDSFKAVAFDFNGAHLVVNKTTANTEKLYINWKKQIENLNKNDK